VCDAAGFWRRRPRVITRNSAGAGGGGFWVFFCAIGGVFLGGVGHCGVKYGPALCLVGLVWCAFVMWRQVLFARPFGGGLKLMGWLASLFGLSCGSLHSPSTGSCVVFCGWEPVPSLGAYVAKGRGGVGLSRPVFC